MNKLRIFYDVDFTQVNTLEDTFEPSKVNEISELRLHSNCYDETQNIWDKSFQSNFEAWCKQINASFNETKHLISQLLAAQTSSSLNIVFPELYLRNTDCWEMSELIAFVSNDVNINVFTNNEEIVYGIRRAIVDNFIDFNNVVLITNNKEITFDNEGKPSTTYLINTKLNSLI